MNYQSSREVNPLVKDIARMGGAFGLHLFFCSQSYVNTQIADDTMSQMGLRISYRLANGRECRAILGSDNDAPTKLERFQMVYNSHFGDKDYNRLVKADNFEKEKIIPFLVQAAEKYKGHQPFEKKIIVRENTEQETHQNQVIENKTTEIKTVNRDIKVNKDDFGF
jgi:DNA segregation ATPase FtsK/SpoIIIE-like protein